MTTQRLAAKPPTVIPDRPVVDTAETRPARPARPHRAMRKFQIAYLDRNGLPSWTEQIAPANPVFESAFSAFAHGVPIATPNGPVAVQDLVPGMRVTTETRGPMQVLWVGSMTLVPQVPGVESAACRMTRVMPDSFGLGKPESNLMAGPGARILTRAPGMDHGLGHERLLIPTQDLVDGMSVIEITPPRPITVYHVALRQHAILRAAGIEMESFHPGVAFERRMGQSMLTLFLSMFPNISDPADFGKTAYPRIDLPQI